ncbi:alanine racemase [Ilumatobacter sp.]|uniref:alanine racemase n=1 Tax=Ilumatobacter sp. TaxID=1967498 RepID=UPI003C611365
MTTKRVTEPTTIDEIPTPALLVERSVFDANLAAMDAVRPGSELRPHVKAFKSTAMAARLSADGHTGFCCATPREVEGLVAAGLGQDVLLANESLDVGRLGALAQRVDREANITVAVDSDATVDAAITAGIRSVLIDIEVGLPRCGCDPTDAGRLADRARAGGLDVRGVMGYEGHLMMIEDRSERIGRVESSMRDLLAAAADVGGDIVSGGGTGTFDTNTWCTEIQAGSYTLLDTDYAKLDLPFEIALNVLGTVVSKSAKGWMIADTGLKSMAMDHGNPTWDGGDVFFLSDEHITLLPPDIDQWSVGDRVRIQPAHVDPTIAKHEQMWLIDGDDVIDRWDVDLRHW